MDRVEVVVAHRERATLRVGDVYVKVDADERRQAREVEAMARAPIPTPDVRWHQPPALALAAVRGRPIARLGTPSTASRGAWVSAGAAVRALHDSPMPPWPGTTPDEFPARLDAECGWLIDHAVLPREAVERNRRLADVALGTWASVFAHGDLQPEHVVVEGDTVVGVLDWSEAGPGDALFDLATLTLGHGEHLPAVAAGYGGDVDLELVRARWSLRGLLNIRWLIEHGFDPAAPGCEVEVLLAQR